MRFEPEEEGSTIFGGGHNPRPENCNFARGIATWQSNPSGSAFEAITNLSRPIIGYFIVGLYLSLLIERSVYAETLNRIIRSHCPPGGSLGTCLIAVWLLYTVGA
jgi:hypothetical protein